MLLLLGLGVVLAGGACPRAAPKPPPSALSGGGVRAERLATDALPAGPRVQGRAGDWLLETAGVRLVLGGDPNERGALLDLVVSDWQDDALVELLPVVRVAGVEQPLELGSIEPVEVEGRAALRVVQLVRARGLALVSEVKIAPSRPWVELSSTVRNVGGKSVERVQLGDRVRWPRRAPFVPGLGFVEASVRDRARWIARPGDPQSYALVFPDRELEVELVTSLRGPSEQIASTDPVTLPPGAVAAHRRLVAVVRGPLARVAEVAWRSAGVPLGRVEGRLEPMPGWARVVARDRAGAPQLAADVARDGRFSLPLPPGDYRVELQVPGGTDFAAVRVEAERATEVAFVVPAAAHIAYRVSDPAGVPLPARLVVRGIAPTTDPALGPVHLASGAGNVAYTRSGSGVLAVPPGRYDVVVTAGVEYTIAELTADVGSERGAALRAQLERVVDTDGWVACDFHLHAEPSGDSEVPLADRVTSLLAEGVELAVATDHNHVTDYAPAIAALSAGAALDAVPGVEITTPDWGHFNAFPYPTQAAPPPYAQVTPQAIFDHVRSVAPDAVLQVNHPRMHPEIGYFDQAGLATATGEVKREGFSWSFDAIEVFNGFELGQPAIVERNLRDWSALLELGRIHTAVGNSDSHALVLQWAGYPRTYVRPAGGAGSLAARIAAALKHQSAIVTTGPFIDLRVEGEGPGGRVSARDGRVRVELAVRAAPWVDVATLELRVDGELERTLSVPDGITTVERLSSVAELVLERDAWIIAIARGRRDLERVLPGARAPSFAFTNPVFVDVDGDGAFTRALSDAGP